MQAGRVPATVLWSGIRPGCLALCGYWPRVLARRPLSACTGVNACRGRAGAPRLEKGIAMFKSSSTSLILLGILAIITGIIALAWPSVTVLALVILFAVYAFIDAGLQAVRAFSSGTAGPVFGHLLLALVALAAGVIALVWPGPTALVLVLVVGAWALASGIFEIFAAFGSAEAAGTRALFILGGLVSIAFGIVLFARPGIGAVTLALLFGLFSIVYGISEITMGVQLRRVGGDVRSILSGTA
jgi:uncharacterized membrane protein HdeD (DUF308 family)